MSRYICIANCPELDEDNEAHCIFTESYLEGNREYDLEICPCGNTVDLKIIIESEETK